MSPHNPQAEEYNANAGAADEGDVVTWDDAYAIACALRARHPDVPPEDLSLMKIYTWTVALPNFSDDPALANEAILTTIISEWFEEANPS
ncbi:MAG TPA: Fe-S cluster assembly protein IscX [Anaerolineales bacterium]|nr:Fe-S cluster assembly protein IscX [Anaerolineales bacterium]